MIARLAFAACCCYLAGMAIAWPLAVLSGVPYLKLWPSVVAASIVTAWAIIAIRYRG